MRSLCYSIYQIRNTVKSTSARQIYFSLIQSVLSYCIQFWGGAYETHLNPLNTTHRYLIKLLYKLPRLYHTNNLYSDLNIMSLKQLFIYKASLYIKQHTSNFKITHRKTNTRFSNYLVLPFYRLTCLQHSFFYLGPKWFNQIPTSFFELTYIKFKLTLKIWVKTQTPVQTA